MSSTAHIPSFLLISNHGQALIAIAENPDVRLREIAERLGITERATQSIVNDLVDAGYVQRTRVGRRNIYTVDVDQPFPHPALRANPVRSLLDGLVAWTDEETDPLEELTGQHVESPAEELARALEPDDGLDRLTGLAAMLLHAPIAFLSLIEGETEVIVSGTGVPEELLRRELPLELSLCQHVVSGRAPMVVADAAEHELLADNQAVTRHGMRAYVGLPLLSGDGTAFGSLCVADTKPRRWTQTEVRMLASLSAAAASQVEMGQISRRHERAAARYRMLLNSLPEALVLVLDRDLRIEVASGSLLERFGRAQDKMVGKRLADIVARERVEEVVGHYRRGLAGERHDFVTSADGETWFTLDIVPLRDADGTISGVMSIARQHLTYGRADQWDADRLRALIENVPGAIYRALPDENWTVEFVSDHIELLTGYPASDFLRNEVRAYSSLIHPEDLEMVNARIHKALEERTPFVVEYRLTARDGRTRWVRERGQGIHGDDGAVLWVDGAIFAIDDGARLAA
ncbi:MAG TPA: PAS domain-containing protein [Gaiellales bacterium]|jgi:PAS domain S-box-containing protein